jgi:hypothetical protein
MVGAVIDYEFYELTRVVVYQPEPGQLRIANASVGRCGLCGCVITGMGGSPNMVCLPCGDRLQTGELTGCVVYQEPAYEKRLRGD